jgi:CheY-like chemotaxis protein/HPt (histidine-containing phosphotransfer) domain-containing protein
MVIKRQLERLNFHADFVDDGEQALSAIMQQNYGLLLTDCHMPNMDGYQLTQTLREQGNTIPIIALTANALTGESDRCLKLGMNDYLTKPISMELLKQAIDKHMQANHDHSLSSIEYQQNQQVDLPEQLFETLGIHSDIPVSTDNGKFEDDYSDLESLLEAESFTLSDPENKNEFLDLDKLLDMFGDMDIVKELLIEFIATTQCSIEELNLHLVNESCIDIGLVAHKIKGSAAMISAESLKNICLELEQSAKENKLDDSKQLLAQLEQNFILFCQFSDENIFIGNV